MQAEHPDFTVQVLHLTEHDFYELHTYVLRLMSFSGKMVIYAFFLGFFYSFSVKKSNMNMNDKRSTNYTHHKNEPQSSHCLIVHWDAHLSYKWYKVEKLCFKGHPKYTSTKIHTLFLYFSNFSILLLKQNQKIIIIINTASI